jgi:hypothetical protein
MITTRFGVNRFHSMNTILFDSPGVVSSRCEQATRQIVIFLFLLSYCECDGKINPPIQLTNINRVSLSCSETSTLSLALVANTLVSCYDG